MTLPLKPLPFGAVRLLPGLFQQRLELNRAYLLSLRTENLLQNHYMEAGLWQPIHRMNDIHYGWESPTSQVRGHFLGHWLSAAAHLSANTGDQEIRGKADFIVSELARCQAENGGEWVGSIPVKYLDWLARGKPVWAPQYPVQKTMLGLWEMYAITGNAQALEVLLKSARWFSRWNTQFTRDQLDAMLDTETGGMLELWSNLYGLTGEKEHLALMRAYDRRRLFDPLLAGVDVLTNMHMNTTIPEIQGAARAWEVTGEERWRKVVEAYWRLGVTERGYYATGAQTNGEIWSPPRELSARLGFRTQEHCTVYNMMRLADFLWRWSADVSYPDYWERNLWNGILAQQHPDTGMVAYFLPLYPGAEKVWGTPTEDFWCCHGTLVQAHTILPNHVWYEGEGGLTLAQYVPSQARWQTAGSQVALRLSEDTQEEAIRRPRSQAYRLAIQAEPPVEFTLRLRLPGWLSGPAVLTLNGAARPLEVREGCLELRRLWSNDLIQLTFPRALTVQPLPDEPEMVAFLDGPIVLAGLNPSGSAGQAASKEAGSYNIRPNYRIDGLTIYGDAARPETFLTADNEREWNNWRRDYRTRAQPKNFRLVPLYEVRDEPFTVYFSLQNPLAQG